MTAEAVTAVIGLAVALGAVWWLFRPKVWTATPDSATLALRRDEILGLLTAHGFDPNATFRIEFGAGSATIWRFHLIDGRTHLASRCGGPDDEACRVEPVTIPATLPAAS